jgi:hypothetical protein
VFDFGFHARFERREEKKRKKKKGRTQKHTFLRVFFEAGDENNSVQKKKKQKAYELQIGCIKFALFFFSPLVFELFQSKSFANKREERKKNERTACRSS